MISVDGFVSREIHPISKSYGIDYYHGVSVARYEDTLQRAARVFAMRSLPRSLT